MKKRRGSVGQEGRRLRFYSCNRRFGNREFRVISLADISQDPGSFFLHCLQHIRPVLGIILRSSCSWTW